MESVEAYIEQQADALSPLLWRLHERLMEHPDMAAKIRYRIPFYYGQSWICYLNPQKKGGLEVAFLRANELTEVQDLLDFKGRSQVAGLTLHQLSDLDNPILDLVIQEAILLDRHIHYAAKRKKK